MLGKFEEGITLLVALLFVSGISFFQEKRSRNAVNSPKKLSEALVKVIRNQVVTEIPTSDIVLNDFIIIEEGNLIPAWECSPL